MFAKFPALSMFVMLGGAVFLCAQARADDISAPLAYKDLMLIVTSSDGGAAIVFTENAEDGVGYRFRYESRDGKTKRDGTGRVFEKRNALGEVIRNADGGIEGDFFITAGPIKLNWSPGTADSAWIYYNPDKTRVHMAHAKRFEKTTEINPFGESRDIAPLDLKRFMK
jgi:hypothetical protein